MLRTISRREISSTTCESITKRTGNVPLSLELIGTLLESMPIDIILDLESGEKRLKASVNVSLNTNLISLVKYLTLFPASFSVADACSVLSSFVSVDCAEMVYKLQQRALLHWSDADHYHFRDFIREHFVNIWAESKVNEQEFWTHYLQHYSELLRKWSVEFLRHPNNVVRLLKIEKQEIRHFLRTVTDCCEDYLTTNIYIQILHSIEISIDTGFLPSVPKLILLTYFKAASLA